MRDSPNIKVLLATLVLTFSFLFFDVVEDLLLGVEEPVHLLIELFVILVLSVQILSLLKWTFSLKKQNLKFKDRASHWHEEHKKVLAGVADTINKQFGTWRLTTSEKEIGLLLLKGLNFQEISAVRNTSERTVRQQATEIYKKAKLKGRHEFAAFFLEDLLLPS